MGNDARAIPVWAAELIAATESSSASRSQRWLLVLMKQHGAGVVQLLWRMLANEQDVLDAYQDCVCRLVQRGPSHLGRHRQAYFYRTAVNVAVSLIRRRQCRRRHAQRAADVLVSNYERRLAAQNVAGLDERDLADRLRVALSNLPDRLRDVVVLRDLAEMPYRQVAKTLSITPGAARVYRRHAILRLAEQLGAEDES